MKYELKQGEGFEYIDEGNGPTLLLLHGLFGALSNWADVLHTFAGTHRVLIPLLPIYKGSSATHSVEGLAQYVAEFVAYKNLPPAIVIGNSLGGHVALLYTLAYPGRVQKLILTGSSGLFEAGMGIGYPRRGDTDYLRERIAFTFFDPKTATDELVNEVYDQVNNRSVALRIVKIARAAQRMNMAEEIKHIQVPTCLIWGLNDNITPTYVAHEFNRLIPGSELHFIDQCGHAAMMEQPQEFSRIVHQFLYSHVPVENNLAHA